MHGAFKISATKWKLCLRQQKTDFGLKQMIEKTDIMLLHTLVWAKSFIIIKHNKNECAVCSWMPLNYALMENNNSKEGATTEVEHTILHANVHLQCWMGFCGRCGPCNAQHVGGVSRTIINIMVDTVRKKREYPGKDITLLTEKRCTTARNEFPRPEMSFRQQDTPRWLVGPRVWPTYFPEAVEISNRNNTNRKENDLGKIKQSQK
jgi:hypothetical protein